MKRRLLLPLVCSLCLSPLTLTLPWAASGQLPANALEGSWELVSQTLVYPDTVIDQTGNIARSLKVLNSTHFAFGRQIQEEEVFAGGGTYTFDGDTYTEHIEYHSAGGLAGQSITFDARLDGDMWYHSGDLGDFVIEEIWRRVGSDSE